MSEPLPIPVLIADDEPPGRELLRHLLAAHPDFQIVAECADGEQAFAAIKRHVPRVAFLDIKMPRLDGLKLVERLTPAGGPLVVFTTAHDDFAIEAFSQHVFDYLLKPFDQERFDRTLARVRQHLRQVDEARLGQSVRHLLSARDPAALPNPTADRIVMRNRPRLFRRDRRHRVARSLGQLRHAPRRRGKIAPRSRGPANARASAGSAAFRANSSFRHRPPRPRQGVAAALQR